MTGGRGLARRVATFAFGTHLATVFFGIALSNIFLGLAILAAPWAGIGPELRRRSARPLLASLAGLIATLAVAVSFSIDPERSLQAFSEPFNVLTAVLAVGLAATERRLRAFVSVVIGVAIALGLLGTLQLLVQGEAGLAVRIRGTLSHYMTFSGILVIGGSFLFARALFAHRESRWWWLASIPIAIALVGSLTRSAWLGLAVALVVMLAIRSPRLPFLVFPVLAAVFLLLAPPAARSRLVSVFDPADVTNYDRLCMIDAGLAMARDRPITGLGPELVERVYPIYRHPSAPRTWVPHLHNSALQLLAERGVLGLLAWLALFGTGLWTAGRRFRAEGGRYGGRSELWIGAVGALVAFLVAGLFEDNWGDAEVRRLALFALAVPFCAVGGTGRGARGEGAAGSGENGE